MCVCVAVQFVNELLSINMNTLNRHAVKGLHERKESVHASF